MTRKNGYQIATVLGSALLLVSTAAAQQNQPKSTVSDKVDSAVQSLKKGAREASEAVRQQYEKARTSIHNMGVASRVYGRIHWDKNLAGSRVEIDVREDGNAILTGTVPDVAARTKAVDLTRDTVGVTRVTDRLTIQTVVNPAPAATTAPKP